MKTELFLMPEDECDVLLSRVIFCAQNKINEIESNGGKIRDVQFPKSHGHYSYLIRAKTKKPG